MVLIVPAAGKSTRFPGIRPKWMLTHPNGNLMIVESISGLQLKKYSKIVITILDEHETKYGIQKGLETQLKNTFPECKFEICKLKTSTKSQCETIQKTLDICKISESFSIKDCDNYFSCEFVDENSISFANLDDFKLVNAANKSYIDINEHNIATNIVEKKVISKSFCVGLYSFSSPQEYLKNWKDVRDDAIKHKVPESNLYISHIIHRMMANNHHFKPIPVINYLDWGTFEDWQRYKSKYSTVFVDLDGVLVLNSSEFMEPKWGKSKGLDRNIKKINQMFDSGKCQIIITTARKGSYLEETKTQLNNVGVKYHRIIFDLLHCKRIIINDFSKTNPYESCKAINLPRNSEILDQMLGE